ncbi:hypothetical protein RCL1_001310 [Eukaryota sp. TZLM3-RCL]
MTSQIDWKSICDELRVLDNQSALDYEENLRTTLKQFPRELLLTETTTVLNQCADHPVLWSRLVRALLPCNVVQHNSVTSTFHKFVPVKDIVALQTFIDSISFLAKRGHAPDVRFCARIIEKCNEWLDQTEKVQILTVNASYFISAIGKELPLLFTHNDSFVLLKKLSARFCQTNSDNELIAICHAFRILLKFVDRAHHVTIFDPLSRVLALSHHEVLVNLKQTNFLYRLLIAIEFKSDIVLNNLPKLISTLNFAFKSKNKVSASSIPLLLQLSKSYSQSFSQSLLEPVINWLSKYHPELYYSTMADLIEKLIDGLDPHGLDSDHVIKVLKRVNSTLSSLLSAESKDSRSIKPKERHDTLLYCFKILATISKFHPQEVSDILIDQSSLFDCINTALALGSEHIDSVQIIIKNMRNLSIHQNDCIITRASNQLKSASKMDNPDSIILKTLKILSIFGTPSLPVSDFLLSDIVPLLKNSNQFIRESSAIASIIQLEFSLEHCVYVQQPFYRNQIYLILLAIISQAVSEPNASVRLKILQSINSTNFLKKFFSKDDLLLILVQGLYDENVDVVSETIILASFVAKCCPALAGSHLLSLLEKLVYQYEFSENSNDSDIPKLLGVFVKSNSVLIMRHVPMLIRSFINQLTKLLDSSKNLTATSSIKNDWISSFKAKPSPQVLDTLSEVVLVADSNLWTDETTKKQILSFGVALTFDANFNSLRNAALRLITCVTQSACMPVEPYYLYPPLLTLFQSILASETNSDTRTECLRTVGALGAVDPYWVQHIDSNEGTALREVSVLVSFDVLPTPAEGATVTLETLKRALEGIEGDNYSTISQNKEVKIAGTVLYHILSILSETSSLSVCINCYIALSQVWRYLQANSVHFLPWIFLTMIETSKMIEITDEIWDLLLGSLINLIAVCKAHIRPYYSQLILLINSAWSSNHIQKICLIIQTLSTCVADDLQSKFANILIRLVQHLKLCDADESLTSSGQSVLLTLSIISDRLSELSAQVYSVLAQLYEPSALNTALRNDALETLGCFISVSDITCYASLILHSLFRTISSVMVPDFSKDLSLRVLACCVGRLGIAYLPFINMTRLLISSIHLNSSNKMLLERTLKLLQTRQVSASDEITFTKPQLTSFGLELTDASRPLPNFARIENWLGQVGHTDTTLLSAWEDFCRVFVEGNPNGVVLCTRSLHTLCPSLIPDVFNPAFLAQWRQLDEVNKRRVSNYLTFFLEHPASPPFILLSILKLYEFMDVEEETIHCDAKLINDLALKLNLPAKCVKHLEKEFLDNPSLETAQALISILTDLNLPESIEGILVYCKLNNFDFVKKLEGSCLWLEMQAKWEPAINDYAKVIENIRSQNEIRQSDSEKLSVAEIGRIRCLSNLGDWDSVAQITQSLWQDPTFSSGARTDLAALATQSALNLGKFESVGIFSELLTNDLPLHLIWKCIDALKNQSFSTVEQLISMGRRQLDGHIRSLIAESYDRSYPYLALAQQFTEVEEIYSLLKSFKEGSVRDAHHLDIRNHSSGQLLFSTLNTTYPVLLSTTDDCLGSHVVRLRELWYKRLLGAKADTETWLPFLSLHHLILEPIDDHKAVLKFVSLCTGQKKFLLAEKTLLKLEESSQKVRKTLLKSTLPDSLVNRYLSELQLIQDSIDIAHLKLQYALGNRATSLENLTQFLESKSMTLTVHNYSRSLVKIAEWTYTTRGDRDDILRAKTISAALKATELDPKWQHAWHCLGLYAARAVKRYADLTMVDVAARAFLSSMACSGDNNTRHTLQDALRFLQVLFIVADMDVTGSDTALASIEEHVYKSLPIISSKVWFLVLPQLIARISSTTTSPATRHRVNKILAEILSSLAKHHVEGLIYPLTVAANSQETSSNEALFLLNNMRRDHEKLVSSAEHVANSLIKASALRLEIWVSTLSQVAGLYHQQRYQEIVEVLHPLIKELGYETDVPHEQFFNATHKSELEKAFNHYEAFMLSLSSRANLHLLNEAMAIFDAIQHKLCDRIKSYTTIDLEYACPQLLSTQSLGLPIPGGYCPGRDTVTIASFHQKLTIFASKHRPRKLSLKGSDGKQYWYLLKGKEDLRQDERVMQLYGLINSLMFKHRAPSSRNQTARNTRFDLSIERYPVIPLSPRSGLFAWVPRSDTLRQLHKSYRDSHPQPNVPDDPELISRLCAGQYATLKHAVKRAIFEKVVNTTPDHYFAKLFWLKARSSEAWLEHRVHFTRSLAVISMVGYLLGLGDRHPSNMMVHRATGKVFHIDHGDCFEAAMVRDQFPESVPFRLTRMLIRALECSSVEGSFRLTCEDTLHLLRDNRDSLMAMLEAFVHDPLVTWKSKKFDNYDTTNKEVSNHNETAVFAIERVNSKLTGTDFSTPEPLDVRCQVELLLREATSVDNLCELYLGWSATC